MDDGVLELVETRLGEPLAMDAGPRHHRSPGRPRPLRRRAAERGGRAGWRRRRADVGAAARFSGSSGRPPPAAAIWRRAPCAGPSSRAQRRAAGRTGAGVRVGRDGVLPRSRVSRGGGVSGADADVRGRRRDAHAAHRGRPTHHHRSAAVVGSPPEPEARDPVASGLEPGRPYDRVAAAGAVAGATRPTCAARDASRPSVRETTSFSDADHTATVEVRVDTGPMVRAGLRGRSRARGRARHAGAGPPGAIGRRGPARGRQPQHRGLPARARLPARRRRPTIAQMRGGELLLTFTVTRGPLHRVNAVSVVGNATLPTRGARAAAETHARRPVRGRAAWRPSPWRLRSCTACADTSGVGVKPSVEVLPEQADGGFASARLTSGSPSTKGGRLRWRSSPSRAPARCPSRCFVQALSLTAGRPFYGPMVNADRDALERVLPQPGLPCGHRRAVRDD